MLKNIFPYKSFEVVIVASTYPSGNSSIKLFDTETGELVEEMSADIPSYKEKENVLIDSQLFISYLEKWNIINNTSKQFCHKDKNYYICTLQPINEWKQYSFTENINQYV